MADLAAALILGVALLALILWYFRRSARDRQRPGAAAETPAAAPTQDSSTDDEAPVGESAPEPTPPPPPPSVPPPSSAKGRPSAERAATKPARSPRIIEDDDEGHEDDDDLTLITLTPPEVLQLPITRPSTPSYGDEEEEKDEEEEEVTEEPSAVPIIYDDDAAVDEPTSTSPLLLISAVAQTDLGQRRKKNEDSFLCMDDQHLFVVADGMGGHKGGEVASKLAVETMAKAFLSQSWTADSSYPGVPRRGSELALAIQRANQAVHQASQKDRSLAGMGTTIVSARFSPNKQRLYVGHVGDSRCYRMRDGQLTQLTTDHTMGAAGITGPMANHLSRAIGVAPAVKVDLIIARPHPGDVYVLCSDGLSKMASDDAIQDVLRAEPNPENASKALVERANAGGGRDNITVVLIRVSDPKDFAQIVKRSS